MACEAEYDARAAALAAYQVSLAALQAATDLYDAAFAVYESDQMALASADMAYWECVSNNSLSAAESPRARMHARVEKMRLRQQQMAGELATIKHLLLDEAGEAWPEGKV